MKRVEHGDGLTQWNSRNLGELDPDVTDVVAKREISGPPLVGTALVVSPHPMGVQGQQVFDAQAAALVPGETLAVFLARHGVLAGQQWRVSLGGVDMPELMWGRVKPKHGHLIEARRVPGEDVLKIVAVVALAYFTFGMGGMAGGSFMTLTGASGYIAAGVAYIAGSMVINKLLGPKPLENSQANNTSNPSYALNGGRNQARLFEPMGLVLGQPYCVPDMAAQPYTYFANGEQYLWQLLHAGINCASVDTIRVGQTALSLYQGVTLSYDGFATGNTGLPVLTSSVDTIAGALLDAPGGTGPWVTRTSSVNTIQLVVDIEGSLLTVADNGAYQNALCEIEVEYRAVGSGTWLLLGPRDPYTVTIPAVYTGEYFGEGASNFVMLSPETTQFITPTTVRLNNANTRPLRVSLQRAVAAGQYEVRARKVTANATATSAQNTISWSTLKSFQLDTGNYKGQARLGIQIQASGQLNGSLDEVNWMATMKPCPYWNGSAWVTATDRTNGLSNPGTLILLLARGIYDVDGRLLAGLGFADAQIDIEGIKRFMVRCAAKGFTFDYFVQETTSIGDLLNAIAAAGMGTISWHPGTLSVIFFSESDPVESVLNMGTMKVKSFTVDYDTQATADEIEFQYFDRNRGNAWKSVRVLAPTVTVPTDTGRQKLVGVTTEVHAAQLARFSMAQNVYQRKTVSCEVDLEHLTFRRGTVMAISHDVTQWGYGGRVKGAVNAAGTVTLTLDDIVPAVSPTGATTRYVGLRLAGESQYRIFPIAAFTGSSRTLTLATAWPGGVPVPGDSAANLAWDTVWIYDFKATPGQKMRVADVSPQGNLDGARVALVPETDEFWTYVWTGAYTPPPNGSLLQGAPVVSGVVVKELLKRQGNTYYTELTMTFSVTGAYDNAELWGAVGAGVLQKLDSTRSLSLTWQAGLSETWALELRTFSAINAGTPYRMGYIVAGLAAVPADVASISYALEQFGIRLSWPKGPDVDLREHEIRVGGSDWESATFLKSVPAPALDTLWEIQTTGSRVVRIKARDTSENYSANAASVTTVISGPAAPTTFGYTLTGPDIVLAWGIPASGFLVDRYEFRIGASWAAGVFVDSTKATGFRTKATFSGSQTWWVAGIDAAGNVGTAASVNITINAPSVVTSQRAEVIDNNVLLYFAAPSIGTGQLPIDRYEVRKGATWAGGAVVGSNGNSTFATVFEQSSGSYTYWVAAVDTAGNVGAAVAIVATVSQPPDYLLRNDYNSPLTGTPAANVTRTVTNLYVEDGAYYGPVDTTQTWDTHFSGNGWATPDAQVAAGFPVYANPSLTSGSYEEVIDYGAAIPATIITVTLGTTLAAGTVTPTCSISWKLNIGDSWTALAAGATTALLPSFRYIKVHYDFTCTAGANLIRLDSLNVKLAIKNRTDSGTGTAATGGTVVNFGYPFVDADTPIVQPGGTTPRIAVVDFTDTPNPTGFTVKIYSLAGVDVGGPFSWTARGY